MKNWRTREDRKAVRIGVRVRTDAGWIDATVRNLSSRGMMLQSLEPLQRNAFVEITRGRTRVVGRVVWSDDVNFGLQAQDAIDVSGLLTNPGMQAAGAVADRRSAQRPSGPARSYIALDRATSSRLMGRAMELAVVILAFASVSILTVTSALEAAEKPLEQVRNALSSQPH